MEQGGSPGCGSLGTTDAGVCEARDPVRSRPGHLLGLGTQSLLGIRKLLLLSHVPIGVSIRRGTLGRETCRGQQGSSGRGSSEAEGAGSPRPSSHLSPLQPPALQTAQTGRLAALRSATPRAGWCSTEGLTGPCLMGTGRRGLMQRLPGGRRAFWDHPGCGKNPASWSCRPEVPSSSLDANGGHFLLREMTHSSCAHPHSNHKGRGLPRASHALLLPAKSLRFRGPGRS